MNFFAVSLSTLIFLNILHCFVWLTTAVVTRSFWHVLHLPRTPGAVNSALAETMKGKDRENMWKHLNGTGLPLFRNCSIILSYLTLDGVASVAVLMGLICKGLCHKSWPQQNNNKLNGSHPYHSCSKLNKR